MKYIVNIILLTLLLAVGCTGRFEEMNTDPGSVTNVNPKYVLPTLQEITTRIEATEGYQTTENLHTQFWCQYYTNTTSGWATDRYGYNDTWAMDFWDSYYTALKHLKVIGETIDEYPEYTNIYQMIRIVVAHATIGMTDTFGDLPYFEAALGDNTPSYDSQKDIYYDVFQELTEASEILSQNLDGQDTCSEENDLFFAGDIEKWCKFANSLRLRYALRLVYVDPEKALAEGEAALAAGVMESNDDRCYLTVNTSSWGHPLYQIASWKGFMMSKTMENILKYSSSVTDPRMVLWFGQTVNYVKKYVKMEDVDLVYKGEQFSGVPNGQTDVTLGQTDDDGWQIYGVDNNSNVYGLQGFPAWNSNNMTSSGDTNPVPLALPFKVMTYGEVCQLKAEAALRGWSGAGDAQANYEAGIRAAFEDERNGVDASLYSTADDETYITTGNVAWDESASDLAKLEKIAVQKWLALYPYSIEAWAECRRTGFPELMPVYQSDEPTIDPSNNEFIRKLRYSDAERRDNAANSLDSSLNQGQGDGANVRVWWDTNEGNSISD